MIGDIRLDETRLGPPPDRDDEKKPAALNVTFDTACVVREGDDSVVSEPPLDEYDRMRFLLNDMDLCVSKKTYVNCRVIEETRDFERKRDKLTFTFRSLNFINIIGSVTMPALLTLSSTAQYYDACFWLSFSLSIATGLSTSTISMFQINRRHYMYSKSLELIKENFYSFVSLSGKYCTCVSHTSAFKAFSGRHEALLGLVAKKEFQSKNKLSVTTPQTPKTTKSGKWSPT